MKLILQGRKRSNPIRILTYNDHTNTRPTFLALLQTAFKQEDPQPFLVLKQFRLGE